MTSYTAHIHLKKSLLALGIVTALTGQMAVVVKFSDDI